jgi:hypothetical protein
MPTRLKPCIRLGILLLFPALRLLGQSDSLLRPPLPVVEELFVAIPFKQVFPGCEHIRDYADQRTCADQKLEAFIYENLIYPKKAKNKKQGGAKVQPRPLRRKNTKGTVSTSNRV